MPKFTWNDDVKILSGGRAGEIGAVVCITEESDRHGEYLDRFPSGVTYLIEFGDGSEVEVDEQSLERASDDT